MTDEKFIKKASKDLKRIYSNKSSDEYKMKGDIKKHPVYDTLSNDIQTLGNDVKNVPTKTITAIKDMFTSLQKPIFKKMVSEYMAKPEPKNIIYTMCFTIGYRYMITTIMYIQTNIEASENGLVFKSTTVRPQDKTIYEYVIKNGKDYDKYVENLYKQYEKKAKQDKPVVATESADITQEAASLGVVSAAVNTVVGLIEGVFGILNGIFKTAASLNPISLISACLSRSYDKKVEQYEKISKELEATKKAYAEYKKIPATQRKKRIEHKYVKMIDKYNIKMANLKAKIDHFDTRASKGSEDDEDEEKTNVSSKGDKDLPDSSSTVDTSSNKRDDLDF